MVFLPGIGIISLAKSLSVKDFLAPSGAAVAAVMRTNKAGKRV
jgi:hypothetical protein